MKKLISVFYWYSHPSTNAFFVAAVFPNLVIYHELRDFGYDPRDKILLLVISHEPPKSPWF